MSRRLQIAIIGAGIIGTTTAFRLFEEFGDSVEITIFSDRFSPNTTGDISAGLWGPYLLRDTPQHKILKSSRDTHEFLHKLWKNGEAAVAGICLIPIIRVTDDPSEEYDAFWNDVVFGFSRLDKTQSERLNQAQNSNYTSGVQFISFTSEPLKLLPYLYEKLIKFGVHMI